MNLDLIKYSINNLFQRKRRSFLTILSIFIGIMAIFALASFGQGLSKYVNSLAQDQGADKIIIQPKSAFGPTYVDQSTLFTAEDIDFISRINGVQETAGMLFESVKVQQQLDGPAKYRYIISLPSDTKQLDLVMTTFMVEVDQGRLLKKGDKAKVMVGADYALDNKLFARGVEPGDKLYINDQRVDVVGIFASVGNPQDDSQVYMTEEGMVEYLGFAEQYGYILAQAQPNVDPSTLADKIRERFRRHLGEAKGEETFTVQTFEDYIATFSAIIDGLNAVLILIALISVLVAAVNITNTMYTAVLERTNEIGVMKAIGARNRSIWFIFVFEAAMLGVLGAAVGILMGFGIAELGGFIAAQAGYSGLAPAYPWWLIVGSLAFGLVMGAASGFAPALQAARQNPVQALRYE